MKHKPEIKKIKKQETAKKEYKSKDYIVYPKHGVGQIQSIKYKKQLVKLKFNATI